MQWVGHDQMGADIDEEVLDLYTFWLAMEANSVAMVSKFTTVPAPTILIVFGLKIPEGMICRANLPLSLITV